jgi:ABC-type sugar transport system substrate-binding protein
MHFFKKPKPRLCLVTPTRPSSDFFEKVVEEFATKSDEHGYDLVLKTPKGEYQTHSSILTVKNLCEELTYRDAMVLIPARAEAHYPPLEEYLKRSRHCDVITFDLPMELEHGKLPYAKGADAEGGKLAADAAEWYLDSIKLTRNARILLVKGLWADKRAECFKESLEERKKDIIFSSLPRKCPWDTDGAYFAVREYIDVNNSSEEIDLIFCSNDEMALGARLAILEGRRNEVGSVKNTRVIGFDGTDAFRYLLRGHDTVLLNSVDVGVRHQVQRAMEILLTLQGDDVEDLEETRKYIEVPPEGLLISREAQLNTYHLNNSEGSRP